MTVKPKRPPGRPRIHAERMRDYRVTLDKATADKAREIGDGSISEGIRRAVNAFLTQDTALKL